MLNVTLKRLLSSLSLTLLMTACTTYEAPQTAQEVPTQTQNILRFAVLGDAEPKPKAEFPHMEQAVQDVNQLTDMLQIDFIVGVGDIAHKGTVIQYENATPVLQQLKRPFYPIMGNEEHNSSVERFLTYANRWNDGKVTFDKASYVVEHETVALVFASPDFSRDFTDEGIAWMQQQIEQQYPKPVFLIVHGAQVGVYPERSDKGIEHPDFSKVIAQPNLKAVISGDLHMDMDRVKHSKQIGHIHYLHIPALERTKIPDENHHTAMYRVFTITDKQQVHVDTYQVGTLTPLTRHAYQFPLH